MAREGVTMAEAAWIFSEAGYEHTTPVGHPERPERLSAIREAFAAAGLNPAMVEPEKATRDDLLRVHTDKHITTIESTCAKSAAFVAANLDSDIAVSKLRFEFRSSRLTFRSVDTSASFSRRAITSR